MVLIGKLESRENVVQNRRNGRQVAKLRLGFFVSLFLGL